MSVPCKNCDAPVLEVLGDETHNSAICIINLRQQIASLQSSESARQAAEANSHQADIIIKDLSMLIKRLCTSKGEKHKEGALDYLRRKGLQGSILRDGPQGSEVQR